MYAIYTQHRNEENKKQKTLKQNMTETQYSWEREKNYTDIEFETGFIG